MPMPGAQCEGLPLRGSPSIIEPGSISDFNVLHQAARTSIETTIQAEADLGVRQ
jgi:hypothetical protein